MALLTIYKDNYVESTVLSNRFIDEYMKDANDAQLKVYIYLIRMLNANQATSVSEIADQFNHTEKDVVRALKYWEKQGLLTLDLDEEKNPVGIHLMDLNTPAQKVVDHKVSSCTVSLSAPVAPTPTISAPVASAPSISTSVASAPSISAPVASAPSIDEIEVDVKAPYAKPSYSLDDVKEFKKNADTEQLIFIASSYLGKPLSTSEIKSLLFFTDVLHFSADLIDYLLQYCVDRDKKDFRYIEKVAISWAEENITTPKQAERFSSKYDKNVYAIMNELGKKGAPTNKEMEYITRWTKEYGFTTDIIFEACERTVLATDRHRFEYAEGILSSWKRENVHHKADIKRIDDLYQKRKPVAKQPAAANNKFNQFTQNNYDFDALEKKLLSN